MMPRYSVYTHVVTLAVLAALGTSVLGGRLAALPRRTVAPAALSSPSQHTLGRTATSTATNTATLLHAYRTRSLRFDANDGQTDGRVRFLAHGKGYSLFLTATEAVLALTASPLSAHPRASTPAPRTPPRTQPGARTTTLRLRFVGANAHAAVVGLDRLPGTSNYLLGANPRAWHVGVPGYARVEYRGIYPGVNLVYYGTQGRLEYNVVLAPGAKPRTVRLAIDGARSLRIDARGNLVLRTDAGDLRQDKPVIYQEVGGVRHSVAGRYVLMGAHEIRHPGGSL